MRNFALWAALAVVAMGSCAKQHRATRPTAAQIEPGTTVRGAPEEPVYSRAWETITELGGLVADAGEWTLERAKDGAVVVWRGTKRVAGKAGDLAAQKALEMSVKQRLGLQEDVKASAIDVQAHGNVVILRGRLSTAREASKAVRVTLDTRGVEQVVSYLTWPGAPAPAVEAPPNGEAGDVR